MGRAFSLVGIHELRLSLELTFLEILCQESTALLIYLRCRTWVLTAEGVVDPPKRLAEECKMSDIDEDAFTTCDIGETLLF